MRSQLQMIYTCIAENNKVHMYKDTSVDEDFWNNTSTGIN